MRASIFVAAALSTALAWVSPSFARETVGTGAVAPATVLQSVIGGKVQKYDLQAAAAKRPVVLYFFPKAFTAG
jgi:thioredoxin-dependent peroxiredoxin